MKTEQVKTVKEVVTALKEYEKEHKPYDRTTRLPMFQFVIEEGRGGALVPLQGETVKNLPTMYFRTHALDQFLTRLDYPKRLFGRLPDQLNLMAVNWLIQNGAYDKEACFRLIDGDEVRAFMSGRFEPLDNLELLTMILPYCKDGVVRWEFNDEMTMHLSITFPKTAEALKVGDVVERGIHISNSEVGVRSVTVAGYVYRLKCRNGAIGGGDGSDMYRFRHIGDSERIRQAVEAAVQSTLMEAEKITAQFKTAMTKRIKDSASFIEQVAKERELTQEQFKACLDAYVGGKESQTLFGVSQAFSRAAQQFKGEDSYALQRISAAVVAQ